MKTPARFVVVAALAAATLSSTACTSVFPVGTFNWGHGAVPMKDGGVRVQVGGGGGAGLYAGQLPVAGAGGGAALEYQVNQAMLLRLEGGAAIQTPGTAFAANGTVPFAVVPYTTLRAGYLGTQLTMSKDKTIALRLRVGGGVEDSPASDTSASLTIPYVGGEARVVKSFVINDSFDWWVAGGLGLKVPMLVPLDDPSAVLNAYATIFDGTADAGVAWRVFDAGHVYASVQGGAVFQPLPTPVASVQVGYTHAF
jgi:hypothetical protein